MMRSSDAYNNDKPRRPGEPGRLQDAVRVVSAAFRTHVPAIPGQGGQGQEQSGSRSTPEKAKGAPTMTAPTMAAPTANMANISEAGDTAVHHGESSPAAGRGARTVVHVALQATPPPGRRANHQRTAIQWCVDTISKNLPSVLAPGCRGVVILEPLLPGTACGRARRKMSTCVALTPQHALGEKYPISRLPKGEAMTCS